jgi:hypothetical protein
VVGREGENDLGRSGDEMTSSLLLLDLAEKTEEVGQHESMGKLGFVIQTINLAAILRKRSERDNVVEINSKGRVDVINECLDILFGSYTISAKAPSYDKVHVPPLKGTTISLDPLDPISWKIAL